MVEDAVAVIPDDASVEMLQSTNSSGNASAYRELLMFCRSEVAIALLGQNQSTEADSTHASAMAGLGVTYEIRDSDKRLVESVISNQLLRWLTDLHEGEGAPAPRFEMWEEEEVSKAQGERDEILVRSGVQFTPAYWLRTYELQKGDIALPETQTTSNPQNGDLGGFLSKGATHAQTAANDAASGVYKRFIKQPAAPASAAFAENTPNLPADPLQALIDEAAGDWQPVMQPMLQPLLAALARAAREGQTAQAFLQGLPALLPGMDTAALQRALDGAAFAAHAAGIAGLAENEG